MQLWPLREIDFISAQNGLVLSIDFCENRLMKKCIMYIRCLVCAGYPVKKK